MVSFWFDRDGLKDQIDGHISFSDILYFGMITVTTVGYGDIVPVSDRARLIDAVIVTPARLFIWLLFVGTAYELLLQKWIEDLRMKRLRDDLPLSEVAQLLGFAAPAAFSHWFRHTFGCSVTAWRSQEKAKAAVRQGQP